MVKTISKRKKNELERFKNRDKLVCIIRWTVVSLDRFKYYPRDDDKNWILSRLRKGNAKWFRVTFNNTSNLVDFLEEHSNQIFLKKRHVKGFRSSLLIQSNINKIIAHITITEKPIPLSYWNDKMSQVYTYDLVKHRYTHKTVNYDTNQYQIIQEEEWIPDDYVLDLIQKSVYEANIPRFISYHDLINAFCIRNDRNVRRYYTKAILPKFKREFDFLKYLPYEIIEMIIEYFADEEGIMLNDFNIKKRLLHTLIN